MVGRSAIKYCNCVHVEYPLGIVPQILVLLIRNDVICDNADHGSGSVVLRFVLLDTLKSLIAVNVDHAPGNDQPILLVLKSILVTAVHALVGSVGSVPPIPLDGRLI